MLTISGAGIPGSFAASGGGYTVPMNVSQAGIGADEQRVAALMANAERLLAERRDAEAQRLFHEAEAILPDHPLVLHERARRIAAGGDAAGAHAIFERLVSL